MSRVADPREVPVAGPGSTPSAAAPLAPAGTSRRRRGPALGRRLGFAAPALAFLGLFFLYPLFLMARMSLQEVSLGTAARSDNPFVGLANYREVLTDADFLAAVPRTAIFVVVTVALQLVLGLALAVLLNSRVRGMRIGRSLVFFIWLLPPAVSGAIWKFLFTGTEQGPVNFVLDRLGLIDEPIVFLIRPAIALVIIILVNAWAYMPFVAIVFMAALQSVPEDVYEAAKVDGASPARRFRAITLPFLAPTIAIVTLLQLIYSFKQFDFVYVLTQGGPGTATSTVPYLAYVTSFAKYNFGEGSAIGVVAVVAALLLALPYVLRASKQEDFL